VPEAGFPLDTFPVSGLPRKPSAAQLRAAWRASAAPAHCLAILRRRRPDVVLGAGGYITLATGRKRLANFHAMPEETISTLKENSEWVAKRLSSVRK